MKFSSTAVAQSSYWKTFCSSKDTIRTLKVLIIDTKFTVHLFIVQCQFEVQIPEHLTQMWNHQSYTIYISQLIPRGCQTGQKGKTQARLWKAGRRKIVYPKHRACWKRAPGQRNSHGVREEGPRGSPCNMKQACSLLSLTTARFDGLKPLNWHIMHHVGTGYEEVRLFPFSRDCYPNPDRQETPKDISPFTPEHAWCLD